MWVFTQRQWQIGHDQGYSQRPACGHGRGTLADLRKDETRTYALGYAWNGSDTVKVQSGGRSDGGRYYAPMNVRTANTAGTRGYYGKVKLCQDVSLAPDWCTKYTSEKTL